MAVAISITPERGTLLNSQQETALLREAMRRNPASATLRPQLAKLFFRVDAFDACIALLSDSPAGPLSFFEHALLCDALLARNAPGDNGRAAVEADAALKHAINDRQRAAALALKARLARRDGADPVANDLLHTALALQPDHQNAYRMLALHHLGMGQPREVLALADRMAARGVAHSWLHASRTLSLVALGEFDAARAGEMAHRLRAEIMLEPPPGWDTIEAFNAALADEILRSSAIRRDRYGTASRDTDILDSLANGHAPLAAALVEQIARTAERHAATLDLVDHPWVSARPAAGVLTSWGVITQERGFENWHIHPEGWMSGVYYVAVPRAVQEGEDEGGCIAFGISDLVAGEAAAAAYGRDLLRPKPGLLALFPSQTYHRTYPHGQSERRICVAFDIWPSSVDARSGR